MVPPRTQKGFTKFDNEIFDALLTAPFVSSREIKIVLAVIRYTDGFGREEHRLSLRYISSKTEIDYQHVSEAITSLVIKNIIKISESRANKQSRILRINKDYKTWIFRSSQNRNSSQVSDGLVTEEVTVKVPKRVTKKETKKENIKKYTDDDFEKLWATFPGGEYGSKGSKKQARVEFFKLYQNRIGLDLLINSIKEQIENKRMTSNNNFIEKFPHVSRWLKNERWADDIPEIKKEGYTYDEAIRFDKSLKTFNKEGDIWIKN
jgi:phage replication O-like protein O